MTTEELIAKALALLEGIEPTPWKAGQGCVYDAEGYVVANEVYAEDSDFIVAAPDLVRELVTALEGSESNLMACLMREQKTKEEMESWMDKAIKAEGKVNPNPIDDSDRSLSIYCAQCGTTMNEIVCSGCGGIASRSDYVNEFGDCIVCDGTGTEFICPVCDKMEGR